MSETRFVFYRDVRMAEHWPERIRQAQAETTYCIDGHQYPRIRFGRERPPMSDAATCHDCAVLVGEFHVPGCDVERCPLCHGQAISCGCADEEDEGEISE
jgi:hypothetical protein